MEILAALQLFLLPIAISFQGKEACQSQCVGYQTHFLKNSAENKALVDHAFISTTNFTNALKCFIACANDCRCMSYNFQTQPSSDGSQLCELNSADYSTDPMALKDRPGFTYHDIVPEFVGGQNEGSRRCNGQSCSEKCCESSPCQNGGKCQEVCDQKRRLQCNCTAGFIGELCSVRAKSCLDHLKSNQSAVSGIYDIQDGDGVVFSVFCDFDKSGTFAWTLVMSYKLANNAIFNTKQLSVDLPVAEHQPNWDAYRVSKARMLSIQSQSSHWRATCNYNTDGVVYTDYARSTFDNVDPMTLNGGACKEMEYVNIRGSSCQGCTVRVVQKDGITFVFSSWYGQYGSITKCSFINAPGYVGGESNFGYYENINGAHRCSANNLATTQFWFGAMKTHN